MNNLIVNLNTKKSDEKNASSRKTTFLWNPILSSGIGMFILFGFFTFIFGSTLFLVEKTGTGVFAQEDGGRNIASSAVGVLNENKNEGDPVDVILYKDPFEFIQVEGEAAYVFDVTTGNVLFEKNKNEILPLASVTKLMTALTAYNIIKKDDIITITKEDVDLEGNSGLLIGEKWRFEDLLNFTLITSSNDGASAIAREAGKRYKNKTGLITNLSDKDFFVRQMNEMAKSIGMVNTKYNNETGLDITNTKSGGHGTVQDMALLSKYILKKYPTLLKATRHASLKITSLDGVLHTAKNTNHSVENFSGIIGSKTGYTDLAGGNLVVTFDSGLATPIVVVVLGSSREGRFKDVDTLSTAAYKAVSQDLF